MSNNKYCANNKKIAKIFVYKLHISLAYHQVY